MADEYLQNELTKAKRNVQDLQHTGKMFIRRVVRERRDHSTFYQTLAPKQVVRAINKGEIVLGFRNRNSQEQLVTISKEEQKNAKEKKQEILHGTVSLSNLGSGASVLISGGSRGCGKSVLASTIGLDQMAQLDGYNMMIVDPQHEIRFHTEPNEKHRDFFNSIDLEPMPHKEMVFLTPYFLKNELSSDMEENLFQLNSDNLTYNDLKALLNDRLSATRTDDLLERFTNYVYQYFRDEMNYDLEKESIMDKQMPKISDLAGYMGKQMTDRQRNRDKVLRSIRTIISEGILGDSRDFIDPIDLMEQGKIPVIQTSTMEEWKSSIATYIAPMLRGIYRDRVKASNNSGGRLNGQFTLQAEEFDTLYPRERSIPCKVPLKRFLEAGRQVGTGFVASAPSFHSVAEAGGDETMIQQPNFLITARLITSADKKLIARRLGGYSSHQHELSRLSNLTFDKSRLNRDLAPAQFAKINLQGEIETFYPIPSFSAFRRERN